MNRKVIQVQKKNPVIEGITLPSSMKLHEAEMRKITGSFLDKMTDHDKDKGKEEMHYAPRMAKAFDSRTINPILEDARKSNNQVSYARPAKKMPKYEEDKDDDREEDISDELANRITYKVFQNIKSYLKSDMERASGGKSIKLEISL